MAKKSKCSKTKKLVIRKDKIDIKNKIKQENIRILKNNLLNANNNKNIIDNYRREHNKGNKNEPKCKNTRIINSKKSKKNYSLRNNKNSKRKIKEIVNQIFENKSKSDNNSDTVNNKMSISDAISENNYNEDEIINSFISSSGHNKYYDRFYFFLRDAETMKFLWKTNNNIILMKHYDWFSARVKEESKFNWTIEKLLPKIFKMLYEDISI